MDDISRFLKLAKIAGRYGSPENELAMAAARAAPEIERLQKVADAAIRLKVELDVDEDTASDDYEATEDLLAAVREYLRHRELPKGDSNDG